jgi:hypothetical protein
VKKFSPATGKERRDRPVLRFINRCANFATSGRPSRNFGHGETFLAMTLAALNLLAFAWHSALDLVEPPWQAGRQAAAKRSSFFTHILTLTTYVVFPSWQAFLEALATFTIPPELLKIQKIE